MAYKDFVETIKDFPKSDFTRHLEAIRVIPSRPPVQRIDLPSYYEVWQEWAQRENDTYESWILKMWEDGRPKDIDKCAEDGG